MVFVFSLFIPHLSFVWFLGKAELRDYGISLASSLLVLLSNMTGEEIRITLTAWARLFKATLA